MKLAGWGRYPVIDADAVRCYAPHDAAVSIDNGGEWVAHGLGRSYGDSALAPRVLLTPFMDQCLSFDAEKGAIRCEAGMSLGKIIETVLPCGWFLPVTPGTKHVTMGGAVASDVHGKNHHADGCFSAWVTGFDLMLPDGSIVHCSRSENRELFLATCGGMGLTGIILNVTMRLRPVAGSLVAGKIIAARSLRESLDLFEACSAWPYLVAWTDCLAGAKEMGRSLLIVGEHAEEGGLTYKPEIQRISVPDRFPGFVLNRWTVKWFNSFYYWIKTIKKKEFRNTIEAFFYPLDCIANWNRFYGKKGLLQYQFVLPKISGYDGLSMILAAIRKSGYTPFLAVLKLLGKENANLLSFPMEGYTLALDFKATPGVLAMLMELDEIVADHGGRVYLAKDARMNPEIVSLGYPRLEAFRAIREKYQLAKTFQSLQSHRLGL